MIVFDSSTFVSTRLHLSSDSSVFYENTADSVSSCFAASTSQKLKANKFIEVFVFDGGKDYFDLSYIMTLFLGKEVFSMF